jgi:hypothetical protein
MTCSRNSPTAPRQVRKLACPTAMPPSGDGEIDGVAAGGGVGAPVGDAAAGVAGTGVAGTIWACEARTTRGVALAPGPSCRAANTPPVGRGVPFVAIMTPLTAMNAKTARAATAIEPVGRQILAGPCGKASSGSGCSQSGQTYSPQASRHGAIPRPRARCRRFGCRPQASQNASTTSAERTPATSGVTAEHRGQHERSDAYSEDHVHARPIRVGLRGQQG